MKKIWIRRVDSFKKAEDFEKKYYSAMSPSERLSVVQLLREMYFKIKGKPIHESRKRLRRSIKIIQQT